MKTSPMKYQALSDNVFFQVDFKQSSIDLIDSVSMKDIKIKDTIIKVISVGASVTSVKIGDTIIINHNLIQPVDSNEQRFIGAIKEQNILGSIKS